MIAPLPPGYRFDTPTAADRDEIAALIATAQHADTGASDMTPEVLEDDWLGIELAEQAVLVRDASGRAVAYADLFNRHYVMVSVYGVVHPDCRGRSLGQRLIEWGEHWTRDRMDRAEPGVRIVVQHYVNQKNQPAQVLLTSSGYDPVREYYEMVVDLDGMPPAPAWPTGIVPRPFRLGVDDDAAFKANEEAFRAIWGRPPGTKATFRNLVDTPKHDPGLWTLAWDGDQIAGQSWAHVVGGEGWIGVVGVRRPWRGRGLGLALLQAAFVSFAERGVVRVGLSVDAASATGAPRLYARAGMRVKNAFDLYRRELRPGDDPFSRMAPD
ncbi:MAG: GNAT family N-acetyltransferase [Thermomicrobiales bacterium]|nr:GNAT family N-acetyltransferase [Thermomicrobiales bacterium]